MDSLDSLMAGVLQGSQLALCELMGRHRHRLVGLARQILRDEAAAEDVVQEAFVAIWQKRCQYRPDRRAWPWIARIVRNGCHERWRRRGGRRKRAAACEESIELAEYLPAPQVSPDIHAQQSELMCLARQLVESLAPTYREVVQLAVLGEMGDEAAAELLGIPLGTVKSRKHRALAVLREKLAGYGEGFGQDEQEAHP